LIEQISINQQMIIV